MLYCGQWGCEAKAANCSPQGFLNFLILNDICVASFTAGRHGCDIAIGAGFGSYVLQLL